MSRELNPELFPEQCGGNSSASNVGRAEPSAPVQQDQEFKILVTQVDLLKRRFKELETKLEMTNSRLTEFGVAVKSKFERLAGATQRLDELVKSAVQDLNTKQSQLASKVNERKVSDARIQELVDRHNQLVIGFEQRLNQMQKLISEQELQLHNSRAEIKEAQREMARLKRL